MKFMTLAQAAKHAGISQSSLYRLQKLGALPARKAYGPRSQRWIQEDIDRWLAARTAN